ncbi:MAG: AI-2E family transporter [Flavobacteriaceae bacterium]|nr:AI-2E family transporter [Flavobacteriaceae bacterium]
MQSKIISDGILRALAILGTFCLGLYFLYAIRSVLIYISIAGVISLIGRPVTLFLRSKLKFKTTLAVVITMLLMIGIILGVISMFIPLIAKQSENLSLLNIDELKGNIEILYAEAMDYFAISGGDIQQKIKENDLWTHIDFNAIPNFLNQFLGAIGSLSMGLFSVLFISFFFLKDSKLFENSILTLLPKRNETRFRKSIQTIKGLLSRYFVGLVIQILILFVIYTIVLLIFDIENAIVIAFLCALLNLVPYIGPLIGGFLMLVLTMTSNLGADFSTVILPKTTYVMIGFVIGQLVDNFFSQPFIFSSSVKSHPLEIFLIIIICGLLFGVAGMVVAVPTYTAIKVVLKEFFAENKVVKSLTKDL